MQTIQSASTEASVRTNAVATFCIVAGSSILFCSKGIFAKLAYRDGTDALTILALRMAFALPFFLLIVAVLLPRAARLSLRDVAELALLGFIGYYLSALVNFTGLQYVSIGLERMILFTYPTLVLAFSAFLLRKRVRPAVWLACSLAWIGIAMAFAGELRSPVSVGRTGLGATLIFASALLYAVFLMLSGRMLHQLGAILFAGTVIGFSCLFVLLHYAITRPAETLLQLPGSVYLNGAILALFGTVAPAILMSAGLKRAGAQHFAVISCVGPVATLFLAWIILGERPNAGQGLGFVLTVCGGLLVARLKNNSGTD